MRRLAIALLLCPLIGASAWAQDAQVPLSAALQEAQAEQAAAEAETARLEQMAGRASADAARLHAQQAAAAQAIEAAEARISAADVRLQLVALSIASHRRQLAAEQQPVSSLLAGIATMARRPPLLVLADRGGTDELVKVRLLLNATVPVISARTGRLSAELAQGEQLRRYALAARAELATSRDELASRRRQYAALEQKAVQRAVETGSQALSVSDVAMGAGEDVERLRGEQANSQSMRAVASLFASVDPAPPSPFASESSNPLPRLVYQLPLAAPVVEGLASINQSGVRSRGLTLAATRGMEVLAPADGVIKFAGPFNDYDGVLIIDHGGGWLSLLVNVAGDLHVGDRIQIGQPIGRALGPLQVELSQNGRRMSPALIAGSSQSLSKGWKRG